MDNSILIIVLAVVTLGIVVGLGLLQLARVRRSQEKRNEKPGGMAGPSVDQSGR